MPLSNKAITLVLSLREELEKIYELAYFYESPDSWEHFRIMIPGNVLKIKIKEGKGVIKFTVVTNTETIMTNENELINDVLRCLI